MFCRYCGKEINDNAVICVNCGCVVNTEEDKINIGLCILALIIPLFGIIFFGVKYKNTPKSAKAVGICGLISLILNVIFFTSILLATRA